LAELEQECLDALLDCCEPLKDCKAADSTSCLLDNLLIVIEVQ
jgi:hypothetical protein